MRNQPDGERCPCGRFLFCPRPIAGEWGAQIGAAKVNAAVGRELHPALCALDGTRIISREISVAYAREAGAVLLEGR